MTVQRKEEEKAREYVVEKGLLVLQLAGHLFREPRRREKSPSGKKNQPQCFNFKKGKCDKDKGCDYWNPPACVFQQRGQREEGAKCAWTENDPPAVREPYASHASGENPSRHLLSLEEILAVARKIYVVRRKLELSTSRMRTSNGLSIERNILGAVPSIKASGTKEILALQIWSTWLQVGQIIWRSVPQNNSIGIKHRSAQHKRSIRRRAQHQLFQAKSIQKQRRWEYVSITSNYEDESARHEGPTVSHSSSQGNRTTHRQSSLH